MNSPNIFVSKMCLLKRYFGTLYETGAAVDINLFGKHPIAGYVTDFACRGARVIVELDGLSHEGREDYDTKRTSEIENCGYVVMRLSNNDIYEDLEASVEAIFEVLEMANGRRAGTPSSDPRVFSKR